MDVKPVGNALMRHCLAGLHALLRDFYITLSLFYFHSQPSLFFFPLQCYDRCISNRFKWSQSYRKLT